MKEAPWNIIRLSVIDVGKLHLKYYLPSILMRTGPRGLDEVNNVLYPELRELRERNGGQKIEELITFSNLEANN